MSREIGLIYSATVSVEVDAEDGDPFEVIGTSIASVAEGIVAQQQCRVNCDLITTDRRRTGIPFIKDIEFVCDTLAPGPDACSMPQNVFLCAEKMLKMLELLEKPIL